MSLTLSIEILPRDYDMTRRAAQVAATRERIARATLACHGRQGVAATSWKDIAAEAGVAVNTVYRHFPSYDELLPACGALFFAGLDLDGLIASARRAAGAADPHRTLVELLVGYWEDHAFEIEGVAAEQNTHRLLAEDHQRILEALDATVRAALGQELTSDDVATVRAIAGIGPWRTLTERGVARDRIVARRGAAVRVALAA